MITSIVLGAISPISLQIGAILLVLSLLYYANRRAMIPKGQLPRPPSVPGLPILGNLIDIAKQSANGQQHILLNEWATQYGDIFSVKVGPFVEYFLNSDVAVKELFDRCSAQTAERPRWIVSNEHICNERNVLLLSGSHPRWKKQRKATLQGLTSIVKANAGLPYLHFETAKFLNEIATDPKVGQSSQKLWNSIGRYTYSTFATQVFGMDIPDSADPCIAYIHETGTAQILGTLPGFHIVDILPWLDKLPLFLKPWEKSGRARFKRDLDWCIHRLDRVKHALKTNSSVIPDAFLPSTVENGTFMGLDTEEEAAYLSLMLVIGAADTSRISTWSFMEAMMTFPDVQKKAHLEIEKVVGNRLPLYSDLEDIPYVRCLMKEVWRWRPPVALGHPHTTTEELVYKGYQIPKGARLHLNAWAIGHDPVRHENPDEFKPERYANDSSTTMQSINAKDVKQRDHFAFGAGRRVCPGYHVAERSLAVAMMRILWAFKVTPAAGTELPLDPKKYPGDMPGNAGTNMPVNLNLRNEIKRELILQAYATELNERSPVGPLS